MFTILQHGTHCRAGAAMKQGRDDDQKGCQPCGNDIQQIIQPCSPGAKGAVAGIAIADHAVGCIDNLVGDKAGKAGHNKPEGGGKYPVRQIFCSCFNRGAGDIAVIQRGGRPANNHADRRPGGFQSRIKRNGHGTDMVIQ